MTWKGFGRWVGFAVLLAVLVVIGFRFWALHTLRSVASANSIASAESRVIVRGMEAASGSVRAIPAGTDRRPSSQRTADRMGEAFRNTDIRRAAFAAVDSDDPAVWVQSMQLGIMCMDLRFSHVAYAYTADMFKGEKNISAADAATMVKNLNDFRDGPPSRVAFPQALRGIVGDLLTSLFTPNERNIDPELVEALKDAQVAPVGAVEAELRSAIFQQTRAMCKDGVGDDFWRKYRDARDRWAAKGALGALIGNKNSGWTSTGSLGLTEADYALVERAILERQPDGLARLLSPGNSPTLNLLQLDDPQSNYALMLSISGGRHVGQLTLCQMGIADCSVDSPAFKDACSWYGGCHQPDLASLMRYVLARDDMDPTLVDRNVARVTAAIYANHLEALGIRRAKEKK